MNGTHFFWSMPLAVQFNNMDGLSLRQGKAHTASSVANIRACRLNNTYCFPVSPPRNFFHSLRRKQKIKACLDQTRLRNQNYGLKGNYSADSSFTILMLSAHTAQLPDDGFVQVSLQVIFTPTLLTFPRGVRSTVVHSSMIYSLPSR